MKFAYIGKERWRNLVFALDSKLSGERSAFFSSCSNIPLNLTDYRGVVLVNGILKVFETPERFYNFAEDVNSQRVPLIWLVSKSRFHKPPIIDGIEYSLIYTDCRNCNRLARQILEIVD